MMGYNSSSSNLSPLALPFTVDRSTLPKPSPKTNAPVDLTDPPRYRPALNSSYPNWVNTHQPISRPDLFPTPNPEFNPLLPPTSLTSYVPNESSLRFGVNPYYPSYVSSSVGDVGSKHSGYHLLSDSDVVTSIGSFHDDYVHSLLGSDCVGPQWVGLWGEGFADWPQTQSSQVQTEGSFFPKESCTNQGFYSCGDLTKYKEGTLGIGVEKHVESTSSRELDPMFFLGDSKSISPDFSSALASASGSVIPRTCMQVPNRVNFKDPEVAFSNPYGQHFSSFDTHASGGLLHMESSPAVVSMPPLHDAGTFSNVKSGNRETSKDFCGGNPNSMREPYPCMSSGGENYFDDSKLKSHLEAVAHDFTEFSCAKTEKFWSRNGASKDVPNSCSSEQHVIQVSQLNLDDLRLNIEGPKVVDCLENYSWNEDNLNPVVDSPCWKGASASHFTPFEVSATPWDIGKVEVAGSQSVQSRDIFTHLAKDSVRVSVNMPNESSHHYDNDGQENLLASPLKKPLVADLLPGGGIDASVNYGLKQGIVYEIQNSNVIPKLKGESTASDKSMGGSDKKTPKMKEQGFVGELTYEKPVEPEVANADSMMHGNCNLDRCSYNVPFRSTGHVYSQSSSQDAPSKIIESFRGESRPQICIQMLVNTIHNLSELLLFHCSTGTDELTAKEHAILKSVIENIDACVPNKVERLASKQQSLVPQSATSLVESLPELQKGSLENQNIQECDHGNVSRRKEEDLFEGVFSRTAVDIVKEESRTQAIKKILAEHFKTEGEAEPDALLYQNLWLEAEALLCSVNYMARYNQMKNENEQNSRGKSIGKQPSSQISSGPQIHETLVASTIGGPISHSSIPHSKILKANNFDDVTGRYHLLRLGDDVNSFATTTVGVSSSCNVSLNLNKDEKLELEAKDNLKETSVNNSPLSSSTCHTADNEASVMARFSILKNRHHESNLVNASTIAEVSSSMEIRDLSKVSRWADEVKDAVMGDAPVQPLLTSSISNITSSAEASVPSRFQVLKQRDDKLSPHNKEENHFYDTCYGHIGQRSDGLFAVDGSENKMNDNYVGLSTNVTDPVKVGQPTKKVEEAGGAYASKKHLRISSTSSPADDVDASVMAQLHILKSRDDKSSPYSKELKPCDDNCKLVGWTRNRSTGRDGSKDEMVDVKVESEQQTHAASSMVGKVTFKEFHLFAKGDPMNQYGSTSGHADKSDAGWYDNFSSDWEHVLKEDFAAHKS